MPVIKPIATHEVPTRIESNGRHYPFDDFALGMCESQGATYFTMPDAGTTRTTTFYLRSDGKPTADFEWRSCSSESAAWLASVEHLLSRIHLQRTRKRKPAPPTRVFRREQESVVLILVPFKDKSGLVARYQNDRHVISHYTDVAAAATAEVAAVVADGFEEPFAAKPAGPWPKAQLTQLVTTHGANGSRLDISMSELVPERVQMVGADGNVLLRFRTQPTAANTWAIIIERFKRGRALPIETGEVFVNKGAGLTTLFGRHKELSSPDPSPLPVK
jgi:hypothetical protein